MKLLLDTHAFIWWGAGNTALNRNAKDLIDNPANDIYVSAVTVWEIATKRRLGKLTFKGSPSMEIISDGFLQLPISTEDAELAGDLDWDHKDPFDRLLVAQAVRLNATFVTADWTIRAYGRPAILWAG